MPPDMGAWKSLSPPPRGWGGQGWGGCNYSHLRIKHVYEKQTHTFTGCNGHVDLHGKLYLPFTSVKPFLLLECKSYLKMKLNEVMLKISIGAEVMGTRGCHERGHRSGVDLRVIICRCQVHRVYTLINTHTHTHTHTLIHTH